MFPKGKGPQVGLVDSQDCESTLGILGDQASPSREKSGTTGHTYNLVTRLRARGPP